MQRSEDIWKRSDVQVVVVSFEPPNLLARLAAPFPEPFRFVSDPSRDLYRLYRVEKGPWWSVYSPGTVLRYARTLLTGGPLHRPSRGSGEEIDREQMGGAFVIGTDGRVALAHRSRNPADRPSMEAIREALESNEGSRIDW